MPLTREKILDSNSKNQDSDSLCRDRQLIGKLESRLQDPPEENQKKKSFSESLRTNALALSLLISIVAAVPISLFAQGPLLWCLLTFIGLSIMLSSAKSTLTYIEDRQEKKDSKNKDSIFYGLTGKSVMFFLVFIPSVISICVTAATGFTSVQSLASFMVPIGILLAWQEVRGKSNSLLSLRRFGVACSFIYILFITASCLCQTRQAWEAAWIATPLAGLLAFVGWLGKRLLAKKHQIGIETKLAVIAYALVCLFPSSEELIRCFKVMSLCSDTPIIRQLGFCLTSKEELKQSIENLSCSIQPMFRFPLAPIAYRKAYFKLTGQEYGLTPYVTGLDRDPFYAAPTIGSVKVDGVKVAKSDLKTTIDSKQLCASFEWTFAFMNEQSAPGQEARLQIKLPKHSAVTGLQLISETASSTAKSTTEFRGTLPMLKFYSEEAIRMRDPVIATMIGADTILLQCAPLLNAKHVNVRMNIVAPLKPAQDGTSASVAVPYVRASNASGLSANHLQLTSDKKVWDKDGKILRSGDSCDLGIEKENSLSVAVRDDLAADFKVKDDSGKLRQVKRSFKSNPVSSEKFVLAIDGSVTNKEIKAALAEFLESSSNNAICKIFYADQNEGTIEFPIATAANRLRASHFQGGDTNEDLLSKAIKSAGENHAQVLWIHAAKPWIVNRNWVEEIGYNCGNPVASTDGYISTKIYSYQTTTGDNQIIEAVHASGGNTARFVEVENHGDLRSDLDSLKSAQSDLTFSYSSAGARQGIAVSQTQSKGLLALADSSVISELIESGQMAEAEKYASNHHQLSTGTAAICKEAVLPAKPTQAQNAGATIGPQGTDAVLIQGISGSGTVRVNNLANIEALLNIIANSMEIVGLCWGLPMLIVGIVRFNTIAGPGRAVFGALITTGGLAAPGCINWLFASAHDSTGFS